MLKLKVQYFGHLKSNTLAIWRGANSLKETFMLGKIEAIRGRGRQRMTWLDSIIDAIDCINIDIINRHEFEQMPGNSEGQRSLACCSPWGCKVLDMTRPLNNKRYHFKHFIYINSA